jgi:2-aminoethylphosphonate-pyruvate transaminase
MNPSAPPARDKLLFTPGPLTTSLTVKHAMLHDAGSWHFEFNALVRDIRQKLLNLAGVDPAKFECVLMQGSGTFGVESVLATTLPPNGKLLVLSNGAYGERMIQMAHCLKIPVVPLRFPEDKPPDPAMLSEELAKDKSITHVAAVHCETTTGILNRIEPLGQVVARHERTFIVDAMSSFAAVPIDFARCGIDYLISSANKCIEGVPGFSFVIARKDHLLGCEGYARSLSLDLLAQLKGFEKNGQFRYTPPTHSILAFRQALVELDHEGGIIGRAARYIRNHETLLSGMTRLGFKSYLPADVQSYIITSFHYPNHPKFTFQEFYRRLSDEGYIIYPGKLSQIDLFRIGNIGRLFEADMNALVYAIGSILEKMGVTMEKLS